MSKYKAAVFIGRFQPFHNGHLYSLKKCFELADKVIVGIGSSQESRTENNPFDFDMRKTMIETLPKVSPKVKVVAIPDLFNDEKWGQQILKIISSFDLLPDEVVGVGNNDWTNRILKQVGIATFETGMYMRDELEGIQIRQLRKNGSNAWKDRVPNNVIKLLEKYDEQN